MGCQPGLDVVYSQDFIVLKVLIFLGNGIDLLGERFAVRVNHWSSVADMGCACDWAFCSNGT